jgi:hypothetical protein
LTPAAITSEAKCGGRLAASTAAAGPARHGSLVWATGRPALKFGRLGNSRRPSIYLREMGRIGRNQKCPCGSGRKYKKCCEGKAQPDDALHPMVEPPPGFTQLVIETKSGIALRNVPPAMPLRLREGQGKEAEEAAQSAAAVWGLHDFVFRPKVRRTGSGVRELGDGMLLVGDIGIIVQVKSRVSDSAGDEKEARWLKKVIPKAIRQGKGTIRQLRLTPAQMTNMRDRTIEVDGHDFEWLIAVVVDHDQIPEGFVPECSDDAVVLLRRDWEFLFDQLKSTHAVGRYLKRVAGDSSPLGLEPARYYEYATADLEAEPTALEPQFQLRGIQEVSEPLLPLAPAGTEDPGDHQMFRKILEDIASIELNTMPEAARVKALGDLDSLPVVQRALVGQYLRAGLDSVATIENTDEVLWHLRRISGAGSTQLGFGVCSQFSSQIQWAFGAWLELRHHEFAERIQEAETVSIGVLLTPRLDGQRPWDTSMSVLRGENRLTPEELVGYRQLWHSESEALDITA